VESSFHWSTSACSTTPATAKPCSKARILIVEDDVTQRVRPDECARAQGRKVEIARNGREALEHLRQHPGIDLVLMDIMMPVMDGLEATREIRKQPQFAKLPIIALTAKAMIDDRQSCLEAGANDYIANRSMWTSSCPSPGCGSISDRPIDPRRRARPPARRHLPHPTMTFELFGGIGPAPRHDGSRSLQMQKRSPGSRSASSASRNCFRAPSLPHRPE
jgi:CheY-like chemotaxis protein